MRVSPPPPPKTKKKSTPIKETPEIAGGYSHVAFLSVSDGFFQKTFQRKTLPHATITKIVGSTWLPVWALVPDLGFFWVSGLEPLHNDFLKESTLLFSWEKAKTQQKSNRNDVLSLLIWKKRCPYKVGPYHRKKVGPASPRTGVKKTHLPICKAIYNL